MWYSGAGVPRLGGLRGWDPDFPWMKAPMTENKVEINPEAPRLLDLIEDPVDVPVVEPEEVPAEEEVHYQYLDFRELWQAFSREGGEDLTQLIDLVMAQAKYTPMASVPQPIYQRVREALDAKERTYLLQQYITLARRKLEDPALDELYTKLRRLYRYDGEALLRAVIAYTR